jgi:hypothetical protein
MAYKDLVQKAKAGKEEEMRSREEVGEKAVVVLEVLELLFWTRDQTHLWHLQTRNEATHNTLNMYYDGILENADRIAEVIIGQFGRPKGGFKRRPLEGLVEISQMMEHLNSVYDGIGSYYAYFNESESIKNILAEIQESINKTKYLLTLN